MFFLAATQGPLGKAQQVTPVERVERFCRMDAEGKQLGLEDQKKDVVTLLYNQNLWTEHREILVVGNCAVRAHNIRGNTAQVFVEYNVWGRLDSSFRFARLAALSENHPIPIREYISLIRSDKHREVGSDGQWRDVQDVVQWRIKTIPSSPHVSVNAAMRYVRETGLRSTDPAVRRNAQITLAELSALYQARFEQSAEPQQSPSQVLAQFITLQTEGKGLTPEGQEELDTLLVQPTAWRSDKLHVARDFVVSNAFLMGAKGELYVEYIALGDLDSSLRFTSGARAGVKVREGYTLGLSNKYTLPGRGGKPSQEFVGPNRWKIAELPSEQWITLDAAIAYVAETRDKSNDPVIKKNAEQTLAKLRNLN